MSTTAVKEKFQGSLLREMYKLRLKGGNPETIKQQAIEFGQFNPDEITYLDTVYSHTVSAKSFRALYTTELAGLSDEGADSAEFAQKIAVFSKYISNRIIHIEGSDSFKDRVESQVVDNLAPKGAKVIKRKPGVSKRHRGRSKLDNPNAIALTPLKLLRLLNSRLPDTVAENMEPPKLKYRTGRFASSVRALGVAVSQGSKTVEVKYMYQRSPYQVFERGIGKAPWNIYDRDPRDLIDLSIREIAENLVRQRIITRRI